METLLNKKGTLATMSTKRVNGNGTENMDKGEQFIKNVLELYPNVDRGRYNSEELEMPTPEGEEARLYIINGLADLDNIEKGLSARTWSKSRNLKRVSRTAGTHISLTDVYGGPSLEEETEELLEWAHRGLGINNGMGVRNRSRIVQEKMRQAALNCSMGDGNEYNILSVAAGSGIAVLKSLSSLETDRLRNTNLLMVDNSKSAKRDGETLAKNFGLSGVAKFEIQNVMSTDEYLLPSVHFNQIEADGIVDYLKPYETIHLVSSLYRALTPGGMLLFSNIIPNDEESTMENTILWPMMYYRTGGELLDLAKAAGINVVNLNLTREPCGMYNILSVVKPL